MAAKPFIVTITGLSGSVESGGLLYSFVRSTSTPRPLYTDVGLGTPATNPVVADALGLIAVYFNDTLEYSWRAKTADGATTLWEADVVSGVLALTYINPDYSEHPIIEASWVPALGAALGDGWATVFGLPASSVLDNLSGIRFVATYAALTALTSATGLSDNAIYCTYGRAAEEDGGFGFWRYDSGSSATANGGTVLAIDGGGAGRFFRLYDECLLPKWFAVAADGTTDDTAGVQAWLAAAATAGKWADGLGKTIALSATLDISSYTALKLRDVTLKLLNPNDANRIGLYASANDNIHLQRVKANRNGDGSSGGITTSHAIYLNNCDNLTLEDCEAYGENKGNGFLLRDCAKIKVIRPNAHDIRYDHTAETDDQVQGIWLDGCSEGVVDAAYVKNLGRTDLTSASRDRFSRGLVLSGCRNIEINGGFFSRHEQAIDITGDVGNQNIIIRSPTISYCAANGVKFANTSVGCALVGGVIEHCGFTGVTSGGPDTPFQNMAQDLQITGVIVRNMGANGLFSGNQPKAFNVGRESASTPQGNYPKGVTFVGCKNVSDEGNSAFTVFSTNTLALTGYIPISRGVRCRLTTSGTLPTGLALATDYYLIEVSGQNRIQLASSYINAIDGVAVGSISGGSGTHTVTLFSDCYDGYVEDVLNRDATRPNRAINCSSVGHTNKAFNGINASAHHAFSARLASDINNITGDGTLYTVIWDTEVFDPSDSFSLVTGKLTAKVTGKFLLSGVATLGGIAAGHDRVFVQIATTARNYSREFGDTPADSNTRVGVDLTCVADMTQGDTAEFQVFVAGSTKVVDVISGANSYFTGTLLS